MNVYDSHKMRDLMTPEGYDYHDAVAGANLVILNTCHIREKAAEKMYSELGRIRKEKDAMAANGERMVIAVAGCVAQAEGDYVKERAPYVDIVVGPQAIQRLPKMVANAMDARAKEAANLDFATVEKFDRLPEESATQGVSAFLTIQEGCDKFCTYCVVPYTRGAEYSRTVPEIYREALRLVDQGAKEITLLGQNVNAFHGRGPDNDIWNMGQLVYHLAKIDGLERIRYTTSHPNDMDADLIRAHGEVDKLMPFIHLPVQSGANKVLKEMNRKHTAESYLKLIEEFRAVRPDIQFSSDFIVGFPGETDEEFEETMALVREVNYAQAYSFKFSARPGTPAANREDTVPEEVKSERLQRLQALLNQQQQAFNDASVGCAMPVLFDRKGRKAGQVVGRTPYMQAVHVDDAAHLLGGTHDVMITRANPNGLHGEIKGNELALLANIKRVLRLSEP